MRLLVNIRGTNGAGKSTVPLLMMDDPYMMIEHVPGSKAKITIFPSFGWIALGTYFNKTGGLDTMRTNADTQEALLHALTKFPEYDILMEGIIASTVKSTYLDLFLRMEQEFGVTTVVISYLPPLEVCLARVQARNGGKPVKEEQIAGKWRTVDRNVAYFREGGLISLKFDTSKVPYNKMLDTFLKNVEKIRRDYGG